MSEARPTVEEMRKWANDVESSEASLVVGIPAAAIGGLCDYVERLERKAAKSEQLACDRRDRINRQSEELLAEHRRRADLRAQVKRLKEEQGAKRCLHCQRDDCPWLRGDPCQDAELRELLLGCVIEAEANAVRGVIEVWVLKARALLDPEANQ